MSNKMAWGYGHLTKYETSLLGSLFIIKIMKAKPASIEFEDWVEQMFGLHRRYIIQYEVNHVFKVGGAFKPVPELRLRGLKMPRVVQRKKRVWVRFDEKLPNAIDFEAPIGIGEEPKLFQLTLSEWREIKNWLIPVNKTDEKFHERVSKFHQLASV